MAYTVKSRKAEERRAPLFGSQTRNAGENKNMPPFR